MPSTLPARPSSESARSALRQALHTVRVRYRLQRRAFKSGLRLARVNAAISVLKVQRILAALAVRALSSAAENLGAIVGATSAVAFVATVPSSLLADETFSSSDVHLACAGIIGTALALVLSLSIVPAQKAADDFSPAILRLYAKDSRLLFIFGALVVTLLISVVFGSKWRFGFSARDTISGQLFILGISLDFVRSFYLRALELLDPVKAFPLVLQECAQATRRVANDVTRLVRIQQIGSPKVIDEQAVRALLFANSMLPGVLVRWVDQLSEVAHKGVSRRDTQGVRAAVDTIATIGMQYTHARRDSVLLVPDLSAPLFSSRSDISNVLDPIHEAIRLIANDAAKQGIEPYVRHCARTLGQLVLHALTVVKDTNSGPVTPLAYAPMFYLDQVVKRAVEADMEDVLLAAIEASGRVFDKMTSNVDSSAAERAAFQCLLRIAVASLRKPDSVVCHPAIEVILRAAKRELTVRGFDHSGLLSEALRNMPPLVQGEVLMEKAGKRVLSTFPAYSLSFDANLPAVLETAAQQVGAQDPERPWLNPFLDFEKVSKEIMQHYRAVAEKVAFDDTLLLRWVISSIFYSIEVHTRLLFNPPRGSEGFVDTVEERIQWFIHLPPWFFPDSKKLSATHVEYACEGLAYIALVLLQHDHLDPALECVKATASIEEHYRKSTSPEPFAWADLVTYLECIALGAEALGRTQIAQECRSRIALPAGLSERDVRVYTEAKENRLGHLRRRLGERESEFRISEPHDPIPLLRKLIRHQAIRN